MQSGDQRHDGSGPRGGVQKNNCGGMEKVGDEQLKERLFEYVARGGDVGQEEEGRRRKKKEEEEGRRRRRLRGREAERREKPAASSSREAGAETRRSRGGVPIGQTATTGNPGDGPTKRKSEEENK